MDHLSPDKIAGKVKAAEKKIKIGGIYRHYRGKKYKVLGIGIHSETLEEMVIYEALYESGTKNWVRPLKNFLEDALVKGKVVPRFELVGEK